MDNTHPKVLFHYPILNMGGAEMSSLRLMKALVDSGWNVTLVLTTGGGVLEEKLDPRIRVIRLRPWAAGERFVRARGLTERICALPDLTCYCAAYAIGLARTLPFFFRKYQAAVTLLHGTSTWFIRRMVNARVRVHWIRNDLRGADRDGRTAAAIAAVCQEIDYYICVSEVARQSLVCAVPETKPKARVIYNILDADTMRARSMQGRDPFGSRREGITRILTVCRLSEAPKGLVRMARVCRRLAEDGHKFLWYIAGDGPDRQLLECEIANLGLKEYMVLLGSLENPFPAYRHADIVAVLSNYEGLCGVVNEAKIVGKPVIATQFSGIEEQITSWKTGLIVENNEDAIYKGLSTLLVDSELRHRLSVPILPTELLDDALKLTQIDHIFKGLTTALPT